MRPLLMLALLGACQEGAVPRKAVPAAPAPASDAASGPVAERVTFPSGSLTLAGYLYRPAGAGPFPAIVYNHGSEPEPGKKHGQAEFFVPRGYVVFVPHRRGQGESKAAAANIRTLNDPAKPELLVTALTDHNDDVRAAIAYVSSLPYVDKHRIATVGCSFGGIQALLAAERADGIVAAVDFAGAAIMWSKNEPLRERLKQAARNAKVPVLFIQAENDFDTAPSQVLSAEMTAAGKTARMHIYPPNGTTHNDGHGFCAGGANPAWGDEVAEFLAAAMR